jgi:hypothetical protein
MTRAKLAISAAAAALTLAACGGGGGSSTPVTAETQTQREDREASASVAGLVSFAQGQIASATTDTVEPREVSGISPPASDTDEPLAI